MFSVLLQKDLLKKRSRSLTECFFKHNYFHVCHGRFAVFFSVLSCCVSSGCHSVLGCQTCPLVKRIDPSTMFCCCCCCCCCCCFVLFFLPPPPRHVEGFHTSRTENITLKSPQDGLIFSGT